MGLQKGSPILVLNLTIDFCESTNSCIFLVLWRATFFWPPDHIFEQKLRFWSTNWPSGGVPVPVRSGWPPSFCARFKKKRRRFFLNLVQKRRPGNASVFALSRTIRQTFLSQPYARSLRIVAAFFLESSSGGGGDSSGGPKMPIFGQKTRFLAPGLPVSLSL